MSKEIPKGDAFDRLKAYYSVLSSVGYSGTDPDGAPVGDHGPALLGALTGNDTDFSSWTLEMLRRECWRQFFTNPFVGTATRDAANSLVGENFRVFSENRIVNDVIESTTDDWRQDLWIRMPQFVTEKKITGECFPVLTCDPMDKFVHIDKIDGGQIGGLGSNGHGIIFHPEKTHMPLFYHVRKKKTNGSLANDYTLIPSIYLAYQPSMIEFAEKQDGYDEKKVDEHRITKRKSRFGFETIGGFKRFVVDWPSDVVCERNVSHLWSVLIWSNFYSLMKTTEIDHKRGAASFCWIVVPATMEGWELWSSMTPEQKRESGLMEPKPPGSTLICPPGFDVRAVSPQLPNISGGDTDLREMAFAGLNAPADVISGTSSGNNYGAVKASRDPWGDRIASDQWHSSEWLKRRFWRSILRLHTVLYGMPGKIVEMEAVGFKGQNPVYDTVSRKSWKHVKVSMPFFSSGSQSDIASNLLGVKTNGVRDALGISDETTARKLGYSDLLGERLRRATERRKYPEVVPTGQVDTPKPDQSKPNMMRVK